MGPVWALVIVLVLLVASLFTGFNIPIQHQGATHRPGARRHSCFHGCLAKEDGCGTCSMHGCSIS